MSRVGISHKKFWKLSWYEISLYIDRYLYRQHERRAIEEAKWKRWRVQVADYRNAHRKKGAKAIDPEEIIRFPSDDKKNDNAPKPSLKAAKKLLGSKFNLN